MTSKICPKCEETFRLWGTFKAHCEDEDGCGDPYKLLLEASDFEDLPFYPTPQVVKARPFVVAL